LNLDLDVGYIEGALSDSLQSLQANARIIRIIGQDCSLTDLFSSLFISIPPFGCTQFRVLREFSRCGVVYV
jgi:hypothetical protein